MKRTDSGQLAAAALLLVLLAACGGTDGQPGATGPTGPAGAAAACAGVAPPVVESVTVAPGPYRVGRGYEVTVAASGGGTLGYVHVGAGASFAGAGATQVLTPVMAGGPFSFAVIVDNGCGVAVGSYVLDAVWSGRFLWISEATTSAAIGTTAADAIVKADALCMADAARPAGTTAKALLGNSARRPGSDWPLLPDTVYTRPDGTVIGTTGPDAVFAFTGYDTGLAAPPSATRSYAWTGLTVDWTVGENCQDFTLNFGTGQAGDTSLAGSAAFAMPGMDCPFNVHLYCVEQ